MITLVTKIISGGQTGADHAALYAAEHLGIPTGGWIPQGFRTDADADPALAARFGLLEHSSSGYPPRTLTNVIASDATLIIGNIESSGCRLTRLYANQSQRPYYHLGWRPGYKKQLACKHNLHKFRSWLRQHNVKVLNVAGNRESTSPGIFDAAYGFLIVALLPGD